MGRFTLLEDSKSIATYNSTYILKAHDKIYPNDVLTLFCFQCIVYPLNAPLNPICHLLTLLGAHHIIHVSWIKDNLILGLTFNAHELLHLLRCSTFQNLTLSPGRIFMCFIWISKLTEITSLLIHSFHCHVQNATIPCHSQKLLPFLSVMYFLLPPFSTNYLSILSHLILPSISWSTSQSPCSQIPKFPFGNSISFNSLYMPKPT